MNKRCKILLVDKNNKYPSLFSGFRKNKFKIDAIYSVLKSTETDLQDTNVFVVVLYEPKDIIQIVKLVSISKSIIIGTVNKRLFSSFSTIKDFPIVDFSSGVHLMSNLQEALAQFD